MVTIKELIKQLEKYPKNMDIKIRNNDYGQYDSDLINVFAVSNNYSDYPTLFLEANIKEVYKQEKEFIIDDSEVVK